MAERLRDVSCVRDDGLEVEDELCGEAPARVEQCCDPFKLEELPYQSCGEAEDGCGGHVSFGSCKGLGLEVTPDSPFFPVMTKLRQMLAATEALLHHGSDQRAAACESFHGAYSRTDSAEHYERTLTPEADEWALEQADRELQWLCQRKDAGPFNDGEIAEHLAGLRSVYDTYMSRISCQPGDIPCMHGNITGISPNCACRCSADWSGLGCDSPLDDDQ